MIGILVFGDNHLILRGPAPDCEQAAGLVRELSLVEIGRGASMGSWEIVTKAFREDLDWGMVVGGEKEISPEVAGLLEEMRARGVGLRYV